MASDLLSSLVASMRRHKMAANGQMILQGASCHASPVPRIPDPGQQAFLTKESSKQ